ncbi:hypothetical protein N39L_55960 [Limnospira platensis NIES-39]|uniref:Uncharacterized protein n=1 Tax=Limnospira platensis NIES-46 TaxID=1236695 RepID=A0A5M3TF54_LIMPL|nr:hypothetical protein N39L_55960 [Arthrospira platensis NIES-39]GCE96169.1 hypothetical protein NIES46_42370 [Arthrospira platensis NIES-46]
MKRKQVMVLSLHYPEPEKCRVNVSVENLVDTPLPV